MISRDDVLKGVRECLAVVLAMPEDAVQDHMRIIGDLGADSLDFLDLSFQLEQRFRIRISPREIERRTREKLEGAPMEIDGIYTPEALAELRRAMPEVPSEDLAPGLTVAELPLCFRIATMVNLVSRLLEEQSSIETEEANDE